jgi:aromatic ring hydroxylase
VLRRRVLMDFVTAQLNETLGAEEGEAFHARSRFEEMDAIVFFDDVLVPWERVFLKGDHDLCAALFRETLEDFGLDPLEAARLEAHMLSLREHIVGARPAETS